MGDTLLFLLFFIALALGWVMGRASQRRSNAEHVPEYFQGIQHLLNDRPDKAVDALVSSLELDSDAFGAHLMLGGLFRQRGELERATRVHQKLLAREQLTPAERNMVQLELVKDYLTGGLLDRADELLLRLIGTPGDHQSAALKVALTQALKHKRWEKAVELAQSLIKLDQPYHPELAHAYCALAETAIENGQWPKALRWLKRSMKAAQTPRGFLLSAEVAHQRGQSRQALSLIREGYHAFPDHLILSLPLLRLVCETLGEDFDAYLNNAEPGIVDVQLTRIERLIRQARYQEVLQVLESDPPAVDRLWTVLRLLRMVSAMPSQWQAQVWAVLMGKIEQATQICPSWECQECGFTSSVFDWQCVKCHRWGSLVRRSGVGSRRSPLIAGASSFR